MGTIVPKQGVTQEQTPPPTSKLHPQDKSSRRHPLFPNSSLLQPIHCLAHLVQAFSCLPYLTDASPAPPTTCCDRFIMLLNSAGRMWLCNVIMADPHLRPYINGTIDTLRMYALPFKCSIGLPLQLLSCLCKCAYCFLCF
jgi:hypothetical protein